jgi:hypothetical protein
MGRLGLSTYNDTMHLSARIFLLPFTFLLFSCEADVNINADEILDGLKACELSGVEIPHGESVTRYIAPVQPYTDTCTPEIRTCTDGSLSGSYRSETCVVSTPLACSLNGQFVAHGTSVRAYSTSTVPFGSSCLSELRSCVNGSLSGSYSATSCSVNAAASCAFNGVGVAHNTTVDAFQSSSVPYGQNCVKQGRSCYNGVLSGTYLYSSCSVGAPTTCSFNGQTLSNGQSVTAYQNSSVPYGSACSSQSRTCSNGVLSGTYSFGSCSVSNPVSCTFNGATVSSGQSITAYQNSTVPYGATCSSQTRSCTNGILSGTYAYNSCTVSAPASCNFLGQTVANGQSVTAYQATSVAYGSVCASQSRTCSNGALSGTYNYGSCSVRLPLSCSFNGQSVAHGGSITAYLSDVVSDAVSCSNESRGCFNGILSGSYSFASCTVIPRVVNDGVGDDAEILDIISDE